MTIIEEIFKTYFLILWGIIWGIIYCITLTVQNRRSEIDILDFGAVWFSAISLLGGFKLIWITYNTAKHVGLNFDSDSLYTCYGGICVIWLSIRGIAIKFKNERLRT
jgi:hypothetical protein